MQRRPLLAASLGLALTIGAFSAAPASAAHLTPVQVLLPGNRIVTVTTGAPSAATSDVVVTGLATGDELVGIDRRPLDGVVYGVARGAAATNVYAIAPDGVATLAFTLVTTAGTPVVLDGASFGVDFNPAADALRIVSDTGQNLRALPSSRAAGPIGTTFLDGALTSTGVAAVAYTNSDNDAATGTLLQDIDSDDDVLWDQNPPNNGTLVNARSLTIGTSSFAAFDISTVGGTNTAYAVLGQERGRSGVSRLVTIDTVTGVVTELGALGSYRNAIGMAL